MITMNNMEFVGLCLLFLFFGSVLGWLYGKKQGIEEGVSVSAQATVELMNSLGVSAEDVLNALNTHEKGNSNG